MSGASFQEFFLLLLIGLVVLGPKRLPQVANQLGSWLGQARRMTRMMKRQLEDEINVDLDSFDMKKQLGLDEKPSGKKSPSVSTPAYVHDPKPPAADADADADDTATELPDDYSPAHASNEVGTGISDDAGTDTSGACSNASEEDSAANLADDKKETA